MSRPHSLHRPHFPIFTPTIPPSPPQPDQKHSPIFAIVKLSLRTSNSRRCPLNYSSNTKTTYSLTSGQSRPRTGLTRTTWTDKTALHGTCARLSSTGSSLCITATATTPKPFFLPSTC